MRKYKAVHVLVIEFEAANYATAESKANNIAKDISDALPHVDGARIVLKRRFDLEPGGAA